MQIKIGFTNPNTTADGIRVYRGNAPLNTGSLPAPIDTIAANATSYTDTTAVKDLTYYYIFEVFKGADVVRTGNISATAVFYTGPGNQILKGGDLTAGYYGVVSSVDLMDWDAVIGLTGVAMATKSVTLTQEWLKYVHKGKVLFVAKQPLGTVSWNTLYSKGLVYGVDGVGPREYNTQPAINQLKILTSQGLQFKVRLMRGLPVNGNLANPYLAANNTPAVAAQAGIFTPDSYDSNYDLTGSEWNDLFMRTTPYTPPSQKGANWDRLTTAMAFNDSTTHLGMNQDAMCMEMTSTASIISRGKSNGGITYHPGYAGVISPATAFYWRPVLEMI